MDIEDINDLPIADLGRFLISDQDFNQWLRDLTRQAMQRETGEVAITPTLVVIRPQSLQAELFDDRYQVTLCPILLGETWSDREVRQEVLWQLGRQCAKRDEAPAAIFHISEAWSKVVRSPAEVEQARWDTLASFPDKQEIMAVSGLSIDLRVNLAFCAIERDSQHHILFDEPTLMEYDPNDSVAQSNLLQAFFTGYFSALKQSEQSN